MKSKILTNCAVAFAILAGGCAYNQLVTSNGPVRAALRQPDVPETIVKNLKLNDGRKVQALNLSALKTIANTLSGLQAQFGKAKSIRPRATSVAKLKADGYFPATVISDDSTVWCVEAKGDFVDASIAGIGYTKLVVMFDPSNGDMLSYGLIP